MQFKTHLKKTPVKLPVFLLKFEYIYTTHAGEKETSYFSDQRQAGIYNPTSCQRQIMQIFFHK